jgi:hypothetical protein
MHGLTNRAIQCFVIDTYGVDRWTECARVADIEFSDFETLLIYDNDLTNEILDTASAVLHRPRFELMEDLGTYLVSHPNTESLRRLLRFGGDTFIEFLHSLDELPDRARLAVSDLILPELDLRDQTATQYSLACRSPVAGSGHVFIGILRAMADDYGALVMLEHLGASQGIETISISLVASEFATGRRFELGCRDD